MKLFSIFDDFGEEPAKIIRDSGITLDILPKGKQRPTPEEMKKIFNEYDGVIIGTSQKMGEDTFSSVNSEKIIATASVGVDHIKIPEDKKEFVTVINTPKANAQSVAEYTFSCALSGVKRLIEGNELYLQGKNNKNLSRKPEDLSGKVMGVVGAGNISVKIMEYALMLGMKVICHTAHPENHSELKGKGIEFTSLFDLAEKSDVVSVNLPNKAETEKIISKTFVNKLKDDCIFISVSRLNTIDFDSLNEKAKNNKNFYLCLDLDVDEKIVNSIEKRDNVLITPHIAGGTVETRKRMFYELAEKIVKIK